MKHARTYLYGGPLDGAIAKSPPNACNIKVCARRVEDRTFLGLFYEVAPSYSGESYNYCVAGSHKDGLEARFVGEG